MQLARQPTFRQRCAWRALRGFGWLCRLLPYRAALALGWLLAVLSCSVVRKRLKACRARMRQVLRSVDEHRLRRLVWLAWRNVFFNGIDLLRGPAMQRAMVDRSVDFSAARSLMAAVDSGRPFIAATPHFGSWELAGLSLGVLGVPVLYIARMQKNPLVTEEIARLRTAQGQSSVDRDDPELARILLKALRAGRILTILPDILARERGVDVTFLGHPTRLSIGMAFYARRLGYPIIPSCALRVGWARHRLVSGNPVLPDPAMDRDRDLQRMTQEVMDQLSDIILEAPEQYFWFNKKWLFDSPSTSGKEG